MNYDRLVPPAPVTPTMLPAVTELDNRDVCVIVQPYKTDGKKTRQFTLAQLLSFLSIGTFNLQDGSVTTEKLADRAVTTIKLEDSAVTPAKLDTSAVTTDKIANEAVTTIKIATEAVTTERLAYEAVTNQRLAASAVSTDKITDSAVTTEKISNSAVDTLQINAFAVTTEKIANGAVTAGKIANGAVTIDKIGNGAVTIDKIGNGAVTPEKIATGAVTSEKINALAVTKAKIATDVINLILDSWTISHRWPSSGATMSATNFPFPRALVSSKLRITTLTNIWPTTEAVVQFTISMGATEKIITNLTSGWSSHVNFVRYIDIDIDGASNLIGANYINVGAKENAGGAQLDMNFTVQSIPSV